MALELRPNCERCDCDLHADAQNAMICSYECTFCSDCVESVFENVCPNCGGGFVPRPMRPKSEWREGVSRILQPPSTQRRQLRWTAEEIEIHTKRLKNISPGNR